MAEENLPVIFKHSPTRFGRTRYRIKSSVKNGFIEAENRPSGSFRGKLLSACSAARCIYAYDYDPKTGAARGRLTLVKVPDNEYLPDSVTVDAEGFVWSAKLYGNCVVRYDPDGYVERRITAPGKQTSSVVFGGEDLTGLFITSAGRSYPTPLIPTGYDARSGYFGGRLYHINLGIHGKPEFKCSFSLTSTSQVNNDNPR